MTNLRIGAESPKISIIEATHKAANKYGIAHGTQTVILAQEHLEALIKGKALAWTDGEYVTYLVLDTDALKALSVGPSASVKP